MSYFANVLADSIGSSGARLTTIAARYPRFTHAEVMTHRDFSRNTNSSRAIPVKEMIRRALEEPYVPFYWGAAQRGMQADQEIAPELRERARQEWLAARDDAVARARRLLDLGLHKQLANRLLEPYLWHTAIISATQWGNFLALRDNDAAQPEIRELARHIRQALNTSKPQSIGEGEWHLPLLQPDELANADLMMSEQARLVSAARCARVSYLTHMGVRSIDADLRLAERLLLEGHMSPFEHVATPLPDLSRVGNFVGWEQLRKSFPDEDDFSKFSTQ